MAGCYFKFHGKVRGKSRPRFTRSGHAYRTKADVEFEAAIAEAYREAGGIHYGKAPVYVSVTIHRALPKSTPKKVKAAEDTIKPDVDNILKAVMDALNGVAYDDDRQVVSANIRKVPRTRCREHIEIYVAPIDEPF